MENLIILACISLVTGLIVGVLSGMLGIGGGTVLVPVFRLAFGLDALGATATSLFTIIPTSASGFITHIRNKTCIPLVGVAAGLGGACVSWLGVLLASASPDWCVMAAAACVICYSSFSMFKKALACKKKDDAVIPAEQQVEGAAHQVKDESSSDFDLSNKRSIAVKGFCIGALAGVLSGYVGVGGGFLMVPLFLSVLGIPMKKASGTSLIAVMILAIPATVTQFILGNVNILVGLVVAVGSIPGAVLGARLQSRIPERSLRFLFAGFLVVAAVLLLVKEMGLLG